MSPWVNQIRTSRCQHSLDWSPTHENPISFPFLLVQIHPSSGPISAQCRGPLPSLWSTDRMPVKCQPVQCLSSVSHRYAGPYSHIVEWGSCLNPLPWKVVELLFPPHPIVHDWWIRDVWEIGEDESERTVPGEREQTKYMVDWINDNINKDNG